MVGGADVPSYYRAARFWTDSRLGGCLGACGQDGGWRVNYWKSSATQFHPDASLKVDRELARGHRWTAGATPYLWIFADRDAKGWQEAARAARQAAFIGIGSSSGP